MFRNARPSILLVLAATILLTSATAIKAQFASPPPLSFVRQQEGWTLYSRDINIPWCAAQPADGSDETWLGTRLGIKRLAKNGTLLRLYTRSDGLGGDGILALAVEPEYAWSIVLMSGTGHYGLCRLDRKSDKWETLREIIVPRPNYTDWTSLPDFIATGSGRFVSFIIGNTALVNPGSTLFIFDRSNHTWQDILWKNTPNRPAAANWLYAKTNQDGSDSIFVATNDGLAQYQIETNGWQTYLPGRAVVGGTSAGDGSLWLATASITDKRTMPPRAQLHLTRFDTEHQNIISDSAFLPPIRKSGISRKLAVDEMGFPGPRRSVIEADSDVWLVAHPEDGFFNASADLLATAQRYDEQDGTWSQPNLNGSTDLPSPVAAVARLAGYSLPDSVMTHQLLGWVSPAAALPAEASSPAAPSSRWKVEKGVLMCPAIGDAPAKSVPLPPQAVMLTPEISAIQVVGTTLYALSEDTLWSRSLQVGGTWTEHHLPVRRAVHLVARHSHLFSAAGKVWVEQEGHLWAFDPKTETWTSLISLGTGGEENLVGVESGSAWFTPGYGGGLTRVPLDGGQAETINIEPPQIAPPSSGAPSNLSGAALVKTGSRPLFAPPPGYYRGTPLRVALGRVWYASSPYSTSLPISSGLPLTSTLRGYDLKKHTWTKPLNIAGHIYGMTVYATKHDLYVSFGGRDLVIDPLKRPQPPAGALYRFQGDTERWENIAPASPQWQGGPTAPRIISVNPQEIWLADWQHRLWRWDRVHPHWTLYPPEKGPIGYSEQEIEAVLYGGSFYLNSVHGLRRFSLLSGTWATLTFPEKASDLWVETCTSDQQAVWAVCGDGSGGECVARLDLISHQWMFFTPPQSPWRTDRFIQIVSEGDAGMTLEGPVSDRLYSLDPRKGRSEDLMPALLGTVAPSQPHVHAEVRGVIADGTRIWALTTVRASTLPATIQPFLTLACWNARQGFTAYTVPDGVARIREAPFWYGHMLARPQDLFLLLPGGIGRFRKADKVWQSLIPPPGFPTPREIEAGAMTLGPDSSLWLIGRDTVMHWTGPPAADASHTPKSASSRAPSLVQRRVRHCVTSHGDQLDGLPFSFLTSPLAQCILIRGQRRRSGFRGIIFFLHFRQRQATLAPYTNRPQSEGCTAFDSKGVQLRRLWQ